MEFILKLQQVFAESGVDRLFKKGEFLTKAGEIERHFYFIEKGAVKVFYPQNETECIIRLGYDGSFINSLNSFIKGTASDLFIKTIRQAKVKYVAKENVLKMIYSDVCTLSEYVSFIETVLCQQLEREIDLLTDTPSERLQRVLKRSPALFQHVPLKYIAAYLRMQPETLSRILKF